MLAIICRGSDLHLVFREDVLENEIQVTDVTGGTGRLEILAANAKLPDVDMKVNRGMTMKIWRPRPTLKRSLRIERYLP